MHGFIGHICRYDLTPTMVHITGVNTITACCIYYGWSVYHVTLGY